MKEIAGRIDKIKLVVPRLFSRKDREISFPRYLASKKDILRRTRNAIIAGVYKELNEESKRKKANPTSEQPKS